MSEVLLTALIVAYNHKNSIAKAIESVLEQKTNFKFQIWVLDDASTDGTSDIIKEYANKYPDKITHVLREKNLGGIQNVFQAVSKIDTKYYSTLEGDDYWCDENKLQIQVDILENNPDCSFCAHNTLKKYPTNENHIQHNQQYLKSKIKTGKYRFPKNIRKYYIEPHYSSRVYRTSCLNLDKIKNPLLVCYDTAVTFWFLQFGKLYYTDKIMSVYNYTYQGVYSGLSAQMQKHMGASVIVQINEAFDFRYNKMFVDFFKKKIPMSIFEYLKIKYFTDKKDLKTAYDAILDSYFKKDQTRLNSKLLFRIALPVNKRKKICLELRREKEM